MTRRFLSLLAVLALLAGLALAQQPAPEQQPAPQQPTQEQQPAQQQQQPAQEQQPEAQQAPSTGAQPDASGQSAESQIQKAIQQEPGLSDVTVKQSGDKIELTGTVASKADKKKAADLAKSSAGGQKIVDKIKVSGTKKDTDTPK